MIALLAHPRIRPCYRALRRLFLTARIAWQVCRALLTETPP